jgi:hypothetical protein
MVRQECFILIFKTSNMVLALLAVASAGCMKGADIYLGQSATGSNNGQSCSSAYSYTFFNNSGNWGSTPGKIGPGVTVHLCGTFNGSAGQQLLRAQGSGSSGHPITIKFESGALLSAPYWSPSGAISISGQSYIVVDGGTNGTIQNTQNGTGLAYHQDSLAIQALPCSNCEIKNLHIQNLYVHKQCESSSGCDTSVDQSLVNAIHFRGSNVLIHDNVMHDIGWVIFQDFTNDNNVQIYNNNIYNMDHGITCSGADYTMTNEEIYNNHFHDMASWDTGSADAYHHDGIHCYNWGSTHGSMQSLYIFNNLFDGNQGGGCCTTAWVFLEGTAEGTPWTNSTGKAYVWNNVFIGNQDLGNGQLSIGSGSGHEVFNNTIIGGNGASGNNGACIYFGSGSSSAIVENNALEGCNMLIYGTAGTTFSSINHNVYGNSHGGNPNWMFGVLRSSSLAAWQSACQCDGQSIATLSSALALSSEGVPQTGYVGLTAGANLTSSASGNLVSIRSDTSAGNTRSPIGRPASGYWAVGAYSSGSSAAAGAPAAPTSLSVSVH